jgi:CheY-like chemotaxis protein
MKTILIVEDDDANYKFLEIIITIAGYKVVRAENGKDAVEICRNDNISLILMDIRMPGMDGLEATKLIRNFNSSVPVIAQTAYAFTNDERASIKAGCNMFITKPLNRKTILSIIDGYLTN